MTRVFVPGPDGDLVELETVGNTDEVQEALEVAKDLTEALLDPDLIPDRSHVEFLDDLLEDVLDDSPLDEPPADRRPVSGEGDDNWDTLMAHLGILLTNVASALNAGRIEEAEETLGRARDLHVELLDRT